MLPRLFSCSTYSKMGLKEPFQDLYSDVGPTQVVSSRGVSKMTARSIKNTALWLATRHNVHVYYL